MYSCGPPHMAKRRRDDRLELTYSSYVRTRDVTLKTCRRRWIIGRSGERGSGISVLAARHDDDDLYICKWASTYPSIYIYIYIYISMGRLRPIALWVEYSPMVWETGFNSRSSHTKDSKNGTWCSLYCIRLCLIRYGLRVSCAIQSKE